MLPQQSHNVWHKQSKLHKFYAVVEFYNFLFDTNRNHKDKRKVNNAWCRKTSVCYLHIWHKTNTTGLSPTLLYWMQHYVTRVRLKGEVLPSPCLEWSMKWRRWWPNTGWDNELWGARLDQHSRKQLNCAFAILSKT